MENLDKVIYSDEQETYLLRVLDAVPLIEAYIGLKVQEVQRVIRDEVDSAYNKLHFEGKEKPDALWWFHVRFASPEGARDTEIKIGLFGRKLQVVSMGDRPKIVFFGEALRKRAKEGIPALTLEYIELLERVVQRGQALWKQANDFHPAPELHLDLYLFYRECMRVGYLLPDAEGGGPQGLGFRKVYLSDGSGKYITGENELPL